MLLIILIRSITDTILPYTAVDFASECTFMDVYLNALSMISANRRPEADMSMTIDHIVIKDSDKAGGVHVAPNLKVSICEELKFRYIEYFVAKKPSQPTEEIIDVDVNDEENKPLSSSCIGASNSKPSQQSNSNVFEFMMKSRNQVSLPEKLDTSKKLSGPQKIYCSVIDWCGKIDNGWSQDQIPYAKDLLWKITNALWYVDAHHDKFRNASCALPKCFDSFQGFNRIIELHKKAPALCADKLDKISSDLTNCLSYPCISGESHKLLFKCTEDLLYAIIKYRDRLNKDNKRHQSKYHKQSQCALDIANDTSCLFIKAKTTNRVDDTYHELDHFMKYKQPYEYVSLDGFSPMDKEARRKYIKNLALSIPIMLFRVAYGNSIGTLNFVWGVSGDSQKQIEMNSKTVLSITETLPKYASRGMRKDFIDKYSSYVEGPKSVLRHLYHSLTNYISCPTSKHESEVDDRVAEILLSGDDSELLIDYRSLNGRPLDEKFGPFFEAVSKYFEEQVLAVQERRHGHEMYLPLAISIEDLKETVAKRLPEGTCIPSNETLRLQFMPNNPFTKASLKYTGHFNVKFRVQTRQSRVFHKDGHYVAANFKYLKELCVKFKDYGMFICMDDKAIIPVGEPGIPISTGVRGHHKAIAPSDGPKLVATDHDFHIGGVVPSVTLVTTIPESSNDSFFNGQIYVTSKDKVFQPSNAFRHSAELIRILRQYHAEDDVSLDRPILFLLTDGGPDHRLTYETVKISMVQLFMQLDLDLLVCLRTAPNHSWLNPAERCMSILNLALQHVALSREEMSPQFESMVKHKGTIKAVRDVAESNPFLKDAFGESMSGVINLINERFQHMKLKGCPIKTFHGLSDEEINDSLNIVKLLIHDRNSEDITAKTSSKDLKKFKELQKFISIHGVSTHYTFQLKKCQEPDSQCLYCCMNPPRLPQHVFEDINFMPCPVPDESGVKYRSLQELYGSKVDDSHRPSVRKSDKFTDEEVHYDKLNRELFKVIKVRDIIKCGECFKSRLIFCHQKLTREQDTELARLKEENGYICGNEIDEGNNFKTKRCLNCLSEIETAYYSAKHSFPVICYYCGSEHNLLDQYDPYICDLYEQFSVVRPLCSNCKSKGLQANTWGRKFFRKRPRED